MRVAIAGGARCGKTTASGRYQGIVRHTDDVAVGDWDGASASVAAWFDEPYDCIEGVAVARGLRRWLLQHPANCGTLRCEHKPCDVLIVMREPYGKLTTFQAAMNKGIDTVLRDIRPQLLARRVTITEIKRSHSEHG